MSRMCARRERSKGEEPRATGSRRALSFSVEEKYAEAERINRAMIGVESGCAAEPWALTTAGTQAMSLSYQASTPRRSGSSGSCLVQGGRSTRRGASGRFNQ
jgi:hypothetical protein